MMPALLAVLVTMSLACCLAHSPIVENPRRTELYISADTSVGRLSVPKGEFTFGKFEQPAHSQSGGSSSGGGHQPWTIGANVEMRDYFGDNGKPVALKHKSLMKEIAAIQDRHEKLETGELDAELAQKFKKKKQLRRKMRSVAKKMLQKATKKTKTKTAVKAFTKAATPQGAASVLKPLRARASVLRVSDSSRASSLKLRNKALHMQLRDQKATMAKMKATMAGLLNADKQEQKKLKAIQRHELLKHVDKQESRLVASSAGGSDMVAGSSLLAHSMTKGMKEAGRVKDQEQRRMEKQETMAQGDMKMIEP